VKIQNTSLFGISIGMLGVVGFFGIVGMYMNTFDEIIDGRYEILYVLMGIFTILSVIMCVGSFFKYEKSVATV